jgi:hypothetical protein
MMKAKFTIIEERSLRSTSRNKWQNESEWPFRFSQHLIGLTVGDQKTITYTYPEDSEWKAARTRS